MDSIIKIPFYVVNLLDNSNFLNPVNQRNVTSWTSGYGLDRWIASNATIAVTSSGITITPSASGYHLEQRLVKGTLQTDKIYTAMLMASDGTCDIGDIDRSQTAHDSVLFTGQSGKTYIWAALWEGLYTGQFHPAYGAPNYNDEFNKCWRFLRIDCPEQSTFFKNYSKNQVIAHYFPQGMMKTPSVTVTDVRVQGWYTNIINSFIIDNHNSCMYTADSNYLSTLPGLTCRMKYNAYAEL